MHWKLNRIIYPVYNLGPGKRLVIWVQGCSLACPGCISSDLWNPEGGRELEVFALASGILRIANQFDGITITGGEPFEQYEALVSFCTFLKMKTNLEIMVFSGYTLGEIKDKHPDMLFSKCIDALVDGSYIKHLNQNENVRGSTNQKMYRFEAKGNDDLLDECVKITRVNFPEVVSSWSFKVDEDNQVFMTGIPKTDDFKFITEYLQKTGIKFELKK